MSVHISVVEILRPAVGVVGAYEIDYRLRQFIRLSQCHAVLHMGDYKFRSNQRVKFRQRIDARHLILSEEIRMLEFTDIVIHRSDSRQQGVCVYSWGCGSDKVRHLKRVLERAWSKLGETQQKRSIDIRQLHKRHWRKIAEQTLEKEYQAVGEQEKQG